MMLKQQKLGKLAPRIDSRTLQFSKYFNPKPTPVPLPSAPVADGHIDLVQDWPMYGNDQYGDCVAAGAGHAIQEWTTYAGKPNWVTDAEVMAFYRTQNPNNSDDGMFMLTALNTWRQQGVGSHKILAYVELDPRNHFQMKEAIHLFGNAYIGLALPISAQGQSVWHVPAAGPVGNGSPGSWGGHCVLVPGYRDLNEPGHERGLKVVSWGGLYPMTWNFVDAYCDEAYAILTQDWIDAKGLSPDKFSLSNLESDLHVITSSDPAGQ